jgi:hypothetical protein
MYINVSSAFTETGTEILKLFPYALHVDCNGNLEATSGGVVLQCLLWLALLFSPRTWNASAGFDSHIRLLFYWKWAFAWCRVPEVDRCLHYVNNDRQEVRPW